MLVACGWTRWSACRRTPLCRSKDRQYTSRRARVEQRSTKQEGRTLMPTFQQSRAFLLANRTEYDKAVAGFQWPETVPFNWALEWFDAKLARAADSKDRCALWIVDVATGQETKLTFAELTARSNQIANYLRALELKRGDHLLLVLNNVAPLWEIMLAAMKLGVVVI